MHVGRVYSWTVSNMTWIPMPWGHERVRRVLSAILHDFAGGKKWLMAVMGAIAPLSWDMSRKRLEEYGSAEGTRLYLPVIESEYSPFAVSRSGATGIWQFMRNSISGYGLSISEWTDDRKDFMKSTDAALRKLKDNYQGVLGDWPLAIAAYNAGLGAVSRAIKSSERGVDRFLATVRKQETYPGSPLSYVPKFLAVASILCYPELHGFPADWGAKSTYGKPWRHPVRWI